MTAAQAMALLEAAKALVPSGVYAVQKGAYLEMRNDSMDREDTVKAVEEWAANGWQAHYNI